MYHAANSTVPSNHPPDNQLTFICDNLRHDICVNAAINLLIAHSTSCCNTSPSVLKSIGTKRVWRSPVVSCMLPGDLEHPTVVRDVDVDRLSARRCCSVPRLVVMITVFVNVYGLAPSVVVAGAANERDLVGSRVQAERSRAFSALRKLREALQSLLNSLILQRRKCKLVIAVLGGNFRFNGWRQMSASMRVRVVSLGDLNRRSTAKRDSPSSGCSRNE
jgi:hypothetical protein